MRRLTQRLQVALRDAGRDRVVLPPLFDEGDEQRAGDGAHLQLPPVAVNGLGVGAGQYRRLRGDDSHRAVTHSGGLLGSGLDDAEHRDAPFIGVEVGEGQCGGGVARDDDGLDVALEQELDVASGVAGDGGAGLGAVR